MPRRISTGSARPSAGSPIVRALAISTCEEVFAAAQHRAAEAATVTVQEGFLALLQPPQEDRLAAQSGRQATVPAGVVTRPEGSHDELAAATRRHRLR